MLMGEDDGMEKRATDSERGRDREWTCGDEARLLCYAHTP